jgi:hypothetical protein
MSSKQLPAEPFSGRSSEMKKDTPWLSSEDLIGLGDVKVKVEAVYRHRDVEFDAGRKEKEVYSVKFVGKAKQLVLNSTNRKTLVAKFGVNVKDWADKDVVLFVDSNVRMMGKTVCGVRIK